MKFYILTSENLEALKRHNDPDFSNIPKEDTVVVINSLNKLYINQATNYCRSKGIEYYVTESNGTPSKGKNSVFDVFLSSENKYFVLVDGDDFITPHGVWMYKHLETLKTPPDAVALVKQNSLRYLNGELLWLRPFTVNYKELLEVDHYRIFRNGVGLSPEKSRYFESLHNKYYLEQSKYSEGNEAHCRVTWFSRKAANFKFNEDVTIGEDTLHMLKLKHEALEGRLNFYTTDERPATYVYDERTYGIVMTESKQGTDYEWMDNYLVKLEEMKTEGQLHENTLLPELKINYPENYTYDDFDFQTTYTYNFKKNKLMFPKNATKESVNKAYKFSKTLNTSKVA